MEKIRRLSTGRAVTVRRNDGLRKRCDCARRTWPKCPHPWHFNFKWNGVHFRFPLKTYAGDRPVTAKNDARAEADRLRAMIRDGRFPPAPSTPALVSTAAATAFDAFTQLWRERARDGMKKQQQASDASRCKRLGNLLLAPDQRLGDRPIGAITEDDLETAFKALGAVAASSFNKFRQTIVHLQRWGERKGYLARPWIVFTKESPITRRKGARRDRRLIADVLDRRRRMKTPGEERRLLEHASPWLQRLIIAAVDSCCRRGELLSLQWRDVDLSRHILRVRAEHAKTAEARDVPISARLRGVLWKSRCAKC